jgi:hypothetical protein
MKEVYLAYFDFMGFKQFILNNEDEVLIRRMGHIFRDIEMCLGKGSYQEPRNGILLSDISSSKLNCLNISDTVLFWTNDLSEESLQELIQVAHEFNWREVSFNFPLRGSIVKGKVRIVSGKDETQAGGSYSVQCLYGNGLVYAHDLAENQEWAGSIIDDNVYKDLVETEEGKKIAEKLILEYNVPLKSNKSRLSKVFKLRQGILNEEHLKNILKAIDNVFALDNKGVDNESVQLKIANTKKFLVDSKDL